MKSIVYYICIWFNKLIEPFRCALFSLKLEYYKKKYGGADKVPQEVLGEVLGPITPIFGYVIKSISAADALANNIGKQAADFKLVNQIIYFTEGKLSYEEAIVIAEFLESKPDRKALLDKLVEFGDLDQRQLKFYKTQIDEWLTTQG